MGTLSGVEASTPQPRADYEWKDLPNTVGDLAAGVVRLAASPEWGDPGLSKQIFERLDFDQGRWQACLPKPMEEADFDDPEGIRLPPGHLGTPVKEISVRVETWLAGGASRALGESGQIASRDHRALVMEDPYATSDDPFVAGAAEEQTPQTWESRVYWTASSRRPDRTSRAFKEGGYPYVGILAEVFPHVEVDPPGGWWGTELMDLVDGCRAVLVCIWDQEGYAVWIPPGAENPLA